MPIVSYRWTLTSVQATDLEQDRGVWNKDGKIFPEDVSIDER